MRRNLPERCSLERIRKEAKSFLRDWRAGLPAVLVELGEVLGRVPEEPNLADAQFALSRLYGFRAWVELKEEVVRRELSGLDVDEFLRRSDSRPGVGVVPERMAQGDFWAACVAARPDLMAGFLEREPGLARAVGGPISRTGLQYVTCTFAEKSDARGAVRLLVERGADVNAVYYSWEHPLRPLWGACGVIGDVGAVEELLSAGALVDDGESLYHAMEGGDIRVLDALLGAGARFEGTNAFFRLLDFEKPDWVRRCLDVGAPMHELTMGEGLLAHAVRRGRSVEVVRLLIEGGADASGLSREGWDIVTLARRRGTAETAEYLAGLLRAGEATGLDAVISAAMAGDEARARALAWPGLGLGLSRADESLLAHAAWFGREKVVRGLLAAGWGVGSRDDGSVSGSEGATALHCASWMGSVGVVRVLVEAGAELEIMDSRYGATPLGWSLHGAVWSGERGHAGVLRVLLEAGAEVPEGREEEVERALAEG